MTWSTRGWRRFALPFRRCIPFRLGNKSPRLAPSRLFRRCVPDVDIAAGAWIVHISFGMLAATCEIPPIITGRNEPGALMAQQSLPPFSESVKLAWRLAAEEAVHAGR